MTDLKTLENRVRRTAKRLGYEKVRKSRRTGLWYLYHTHGAWEGKDLTLDDVCQLLEADLDAEKQRTEDAAEDLILTGAERYPLLLG